MATYARSNAPGRRTSIGFFAGEKILCPDSRRSERTSFVFAIVFAQDHDMNGDEMESVSISTKEEISVSNSLSASFSLVALVAFALKYREYFKARRNIDTVIVSDMARVR